MVSASLPKVATDAVNPLTGGGVRRAREAAIRGAFTLAALVSVFVLVGIFAVLFEQAQSAFGGAEGIAQSTLTPAQRALFSDAEFAALPLTPPPGPSLFGDFLGGTDWNPTGGVAHYGILGMVVSTLMVTLLALALAAPLGIGTAAWLAYVAPPRAREIIKPVIEVLAAVPSVVLGFVGIVVVGPVLAKVFHLQSGLSAANGALLLAVMALPTIVSITEDALTAVPRDYLQASLALGADRWQTFRHVILPTIGPALLTGFTMAFARGLGEYGSVIFIAGNMPMVSEITPLIIISKLEQYDYAGATAVACAMLITSFALLLLINALQHWQRQRAGG